MFVWGNKLGNKANPRISSTASPILSHAIMQIRGAKAIILDSIGRVGLNDQCAARFREANG